MMQSQTSLKLLLHQQNTLQARLLKLNTDEEKAQKRIKDGLRRASFL